jgi:hypothetical protein
MKRYMVQVTESINHSYEFEAETEQDALDAYDRLTEAQLKSRDLDGDSGWDRPWDVYEIEEVAPK